VGRIVCLRVGEVNRKIGLFEPEHRAKQAELPVSCIAILMGLAGFFTTTGTEQTQAATVFGSGLAGILFSGVAWVCTASEALGTLLFRDSSFKTILPILFLAVIVFGAIRFGQCSRAAHYSYLRSDLRCFPI
jgi:hypothetical protein